MFDLKSLPQQCQGKKQFHIPWIEQFVGIPVQVMLLLRALVRFLRKENLLAAQVLALSYQMQLLWKKVQFGLAKVKAHPDMRVVSNPVRSRFEVVIDSYAGQSKT